MSRRCRACGRRLRDPESLATGLGPKCRRATRTPRPALLTPDYGRPATRPPAAISLRRRGMVTVGAVDDYQPTLPLEEQ